MRSITLPRPLTRLVRVCLVPLLLVSVAAGQEPGATEPVAAEPGSIRVQATTTPHPEVRAVRRYSAGTWLTRG